MLPKPPESAPGVSLSLRGKQGMVPQIGQIPGSQLHKNFTIYALHSSGLSDIVEKVK
jgi:hypothetical protein